MAPRQASAYGLNLAAGICILGLSQPGAAAASEGLPQVELERVETIASQGQAEAVVAGGPGGLMIESLPGGGYRMSGPEVGRAEIEPGAARVSIEPPLRHHGWAWNRWVLGQVLPFVAALHGRELLHAGGVVVGEEAVAILGPSGRGKSTLVGALLEQGAVLLSDDVIALTRERQAVLAHPGPGILGLARPELHSPAPASPLSVICLLELGPQTRVDPGAELSPAGLLGNVYERVRRDPARLAGQLSLLADVSARARFIRIEREPRSDPRQLARALMAELAG